MGKRGKISQINILRRDVNKMIEKDGSTVTFEWLEMTGGTYNELYDIWEGATEQVQTLSLKGLGRVIPYEQDIIEYEWGRVNIGECILRFPHDTNLDILKDKNNVRFTYLGERWRIDSKIGVGDIYADQYWNRIIKGVKAVD